MDNFKPGKACVVCTGVGSDKKVIEKLSVDKIESYKSIEWIPRDKNPIGASNVYVAATCAHMMVSKYVNELMGVSMPVRTIFNYTTFEIVKWDVSKEEKCPLCSSLTVKK